MRNRIFAILNWKKDRKENVEKEILAKLPALSEKDRVLVFYRGSDYAEVPTYKLADRTFCAEAIPISDEEGYDRAAGLNYVYSYCKKHFLESFVHVFYDSMQLDAEKYSAFVGEIEKMMEKLKLEVWFNAYTDECNFVLTKFDGRISVAINEPSLKQIYDKTIIWASHSNPNYSIFLSDKLEIPEDGRVFDDRFEIPMFWIIKFLCERARDKKGFMNHYPTISEEIGAYKCGNFDGMKSTPEQMKKEDELFSLLKLDHTPNQNVEALMDFMIERLKS